ncbi:serine/arginine rich splicing factor [Striga asiatica]|uniref:Serine/arginine rich splicing factor n=1 Tax=Striga asiatica TaxID=4170 RepID=A0A5A7NZ35_STRAF|nr:serine/arginine rich splicing factor [Striga asiatica]
MSHFGRSGPPDIKDTFSLLVLNITFRTTADDLFPLFDKYGKVVDVFIPRDRRTGDSRGFAFVRYKYQDEAQKAVEKLDGKVVDGREIMVQFAKYGPNAERIHKGRIEEPVYRSKGRSRSRSPRPSFSISTLYLSSMIFESFCAKTKMEVVSRSDYRDRDYRRRSRSRSRDRYERDRHRGRDKHSRYRSRSRSRSLSRSLSPDCRRELVLLLRGEALAHGGVLLQSDHHHCPLEVEARGPVTRKNVPSALEVSPLELVIILEANLHVLRLMIRSGVLWNESEDMVPEYGSICVLSKLNLHIIVCMVISKTYFPPGNISKVLYLSVVLYQLSFYVLMDTYFKFVD